MSNLKKVKVDQEDSHYQQAQSWEADKADMLKKSEKRAWTIAKIATAIAVLEAIGLVTLAPMRQTVPVVFSVDKAHGNIEYVTTVDDQTVKGKQELVDKNNLTRYVVARENYYYRLLQPDYDLVVAMSSSQIGSDFAALYEGDDARDKKYGKNYELKVNIISVQTSQDEAGNTAFVRFTKTLHSVEANRDQPPQYFVATIRYEYQTMQLGASEADLIKNPFGFKVVGYRVDPELAPVNASAQQRLTADPVPQPVEPLQQPQENQVVVVQPTQPAQ